MLCYKRKHALLRQAPVLANISISFPKGFDVSGTIGMALLNKMCLHSYLSFTIQQALALNLYSTAAKS